MVVKDGNVVLLEDLEATLNEGLAVVTVALDGVEGVFGWLLVVPV